MFRWEAFKAELDKDNSHYERFKKSALHDLVELLKRKMPAPSPGEVAAAVKKIPAAKWTKYARTKAYLDREFPMLKQHAVAVGQTTPGYQEGKWERTKDSDGGWHEFILQQKGNSCGPACVVMMKSAVHVAAKQKLREPEIRGVVALFEANKQHTGVSSLSPEAVGAHNWRNVGSNPEPLIQTLRAEPFALRTAKGFYGPAATVRAKLEECSTKRPAIVGWWWDSGGGHWTVCIGPTKDGTKLRILDPWNGIQYLDNNDTDFCKYSVREGGNVTATGWFNPNDPNDIAVILPG